MALTDTSIKQAKPRDKAYKLFDGNGLYIEISPTGSKYWRLKYRFAGKEKRLALGVYPDVSLKQARLDSSQAKDLLGQGIDPSLDKKAKKVALVHSHANNFEAIAQEWHKQQSLKWSESYVLKVHSAMERDLFPFIGSFPIDQIKPQQLLEVFRKVESRGAVDTAHRLKQLVGQIYRYGVATGRVERDISADLKGALAPYKKGHFPAITDPKLVGPFLNMIYEYKGTATVRAALKLAPLVFVRPKELRCAEWPEIDLDQAEWKIPGSKMKTGLDHIVPLSTQAVVILTEQKLFTGGWNGYVFPSARSPRRPMSDNAVLSAFRNMGISREEMTGHGFRAMARTILDEVLQERVELIEHQLAHSVRDALGRAYNRTHHLDERRRMMQRWADYLDELRISVDSKNVVLGNFKRLGASYE